MTTKEILQCIKRLPFHERLSVIERALKTLHESRNMRMEKATEVLLADYKKDKNLTAFTTSDFVKYYEAR